MTRGEAWCNHVANVLVGGTGIVYGWMVYLAVPEDEFAIVNHPWQPHLQHAHIWAAPLLVFATAMLWRNHVWKRVRSGFAARRKTGLVLFGLFWPMTLSGYLVQTSLEEAWVRNWSWLHVATSIAWCLAYLVHQVSRRVVGAPSAPRRESRSA